MAVDARSRISNLTLMAIHMARGEHLQNVVPEIHHSMSNTVMLFKPYIILCVVHQGGCLFCVLRIICVSRCCCILL
jgi:hypothetical protein